MCRKSWGFLYRSEIREFSWNISLVQILVEVANISNVRTLKTKVDMVILLNIRDYPNAVVTIKKIGGISLISFKEYNLSLYSLTHYLNMLGFYNSVPT
ncbi:hypothetical protein PFNF54_02011 [Plasmodium falciparum NF54]|uniref:Uncharacterized protein n=1 Tax=Plasmodium falciparum (isolate NF54) TaxID=5843 RepID=W7KHJ9_PLAFO|nr:hypothetical protein PFNF54_02011 [Plasmodium falciparum NF54]